MKKEAKKGQAQARKPAGKKARAKPKNPGKPAKAKKPGKAKLTVKLDGMEIGPGKKRGKPTAADIEECKKALNDARKANPLLDAFLGFMKSVGFKTSGIKAVYMIPKIARKPPRKAPAERIKKRGAK